MNTYIWEIESLDCVPEGKIVSCIHWRLKGNDGTNTTEIYGTQSIEENTKNPFIAYEELAKEDVTAWLEKAMGTNVIAELHESLDKRLEAIANPPIITTLLPWENK